MDSVLEDQPATTSPDSASDVEHTADAHVSPAVDFLLLFGVVLVGAVLLVVLL
ncbi:hypothetical protein [Halovenus marina]|uniref:hypothetical protein n=1 Tax=Halovenus marina TaxID=3396621 RepID=UPI003F55B385